jgi:hypothetical protein
MSTKQATINIATHGSKLGRIRWMWVFPVLMTVLNFGLIRLSWIQDEEFQKAHPRFTDIGGEILQPADLAAELLNGPGYYATLVWFGSRLREPSLFLFELRRRGVECCLCGLLQAKTEGGPTQSY